MRRRLRSLSVPALLALGLAACDDPTGFRIGPPLLTVDTVSLAPPSSAADALPSAIDLSTSGSGFGGPRFPERQRDAALGYDLAVRLRDGGLVFLPAGATGLFNTDISGARVTPPGVTEPRAETFESIREAPIARSAYRVDAAVPIVPGGVYIARTRAAYGNAVCNSGISQYAKLRVLEITSAPAVRLEVVANGNCNDTRLVPEED